MASVTMRSLSGGDAGAVELDGATFGIEPNIAVMHQVVTAQLAARRSGTQSTKTRAEVRGGGAKPWSQKGTGRARQGSIRSPQWRGGGVALGPKPRSYAQKTPKKMIQLALRSALSDRAAEGQVVVIDAWGFEAPRTRDAVAALAALEIEGRVLVVAARDDVNAWKSFANLTEVHVVSPGELNAYDVLVSDVVVFSRDTLPAGSSAAAVSEPVVEAAAVEAVEETEADEAVEAVEETEAVEAVEETEAVEAVEETEALEETEADEAVEAVEETEAVEAAEETAGDEEEQAS